MFNKWKVVLWGFVVRSRGWVSKKTYPKVRCNQRRKRSVKLKTVTWVQRCTSHVGFGAANSIFTMIHPPFWYKFLFGVVKYKNLMFWHQVLASSITKFSWSLCMSWAVFDESTREPLFKCTKMDGFWFSRAISVPVLSFRFSFPQSFSSTNNGLASSLPPRIHYPSRNHPRAPLAVCTARTHLISSCNGWRSMYLTEIINEGGS